MKMVEMEQIENFLDIIIDVDWFQDNHMNLKLMKYNFLGYKLN